MIFKNEIEPGFGRDVFELHVTGAPGKQESRQA